MCRKILNFLEIFPLVSSPFSLLSSGHHFPPPFFNFFHSTHGIYQVLASVLEYFWKNKVMEAHQEFKRNKKYGITRRKAPSISVSRGFHKTCLYKTCFVLKHWISKFYHRIALWTKVLYVLKMNNSFFF